MILDLNVVKYNDKGLIPAILQDQNNGTVLMMAWMNAEALQKTLETGEAWFYSRSRQELWHKGATSGNVQKVVSVNADCDNDTLLLKVDPVGPACHTGAVSCFGSAEGTVTKVYNRILERQQNPQEGSYTNYLFTKGVDKILKKVGEEASEVIIAAKNRDREELIAESADLMYHMLVLLVEQGLTPKDILTELEKRYNK